MHLFESGEFVRIAQSGASRRSGDCRPVPVAEMDAAHQRSELPGRDHVEQSRPAGPDQGRTKFDHRNGERRPAKPLGSVDQRDFIVAAQAVLGIGPVDGADPHHSESGEFGGTERAHARGAEYQRPLRHQQQQFLVPHCGADIEQAVDQAELCRRSLQQSRHIACFRRREPPEGALGPKRGPKRRSDKDRYEILGHGHIGARRLRVIDPRPGTKARTTRISQWLARSTTAMRP